MESLTPWTKARLIQGDESNALGLSSKGFIVPVKVGSVSTPKGSLQLVRVTEAIEDDTLPDAVDLRSNHDDVFDVIYDSFSEPVTIEGLNGGTIALGMDKSVTIAYLDSPSRSSESNHAGYATSSSHVSIERISLDAHIPTTTPSQWQKKSRPSKDTTAHDISDQLNVVQMRSEDIDAEMTLAFEVPDQRGTEGVLVFLSNASALLFQKGQDVVCDDKQGIKSSSLDKMVDSHGDSSHFGKYRFTRTIIDQTSRSRSAVMCAAMSDIIPDLHHRYLFIGEAGGHISVCRMDWIRPVPDIQIVDTLETGPQTKACLDIVSDAHSQTSFMTAMAVLSPCRPGEPYVLSVGFTSGLLLVFHWKPNSAYEINQAFELVHILTSPGMQSIRSLAFDAAIGPRRSLALGTTNGHISVFNEVQCTGLRSCQDGNIDSQAEEESTSPYQPLLTSLTLYKCEEGGRPITSLQWIMRDESLLAFTVGLE